MTIFSQRSPRNTHLLAKEAVRKGADIALEFSDFDLEASDEVVCPEVVVIKHAYRHHLHTWIKSPFSGPRFVLTLAGIQRLLVQINAIDEIDLLPP